MDNEIIKTLKKAAEETGIGWAKEFTVRNVSLIWKRSLDDGDRWTYRIGDETGDLSAADLAAIFPGQYDSGDVEETEGWWVRDDSGTELHFPGAEWPEDAVDKWLEGSDYSWVKRTTIFRFYAYQKHINRLGDVGVDESTIEELTVCGHPEAPRCKDDGEHDWRRPIEIVGGLEENPGVVGHGGGVIIREVCSHCGVYRVTDTSHAYEAIWYEDADEASKDWVESLEEGEE